MPVLLDAMLLVKLFLQLPQQLNFLVHKPIVVDDKLKLPPCSGFTLDVGCDADDKERILFSDHIWQLLEELMELDFLDFVAIFVYLDFSFRLATA